MINCHVAGKKDKDKGKDKDRDKLKSVKKRKVNSSNLFSEKTSLNTIHYYLLDHRCRK